MNIDDLIDKLATWSAAQLTLEYANTPREVWAHRINFDDAADTVSVFRSGGGVDLGWDLAGGPIVQVMTYAATEAAALIRAGQIAELFKSGNLPRRSWTDLTGWYVRAVDLIGPPTPVGQDESKRAQISFNLRLIAAQTS